MKTMLIQFVTTVVAVIFFSAFVYAAGSSSTETSDSRPGVTQYNSGVKYMQKGKYKKAQSKFEAALKKNPNMAEAYNNLGYSLRKQEPAKFDEALRHYNRAIDLNPKLAEAYMYRGVLHMLMGNEAKALADHRTLTDLNRRLADALQAAIASGEEPKGLDGLVKKW